jgi:hypothetical protein
MLYVVYAQLNFVSDWVQAEILGIGRSVNRGRLVCDVCIVRCQIGLHNDKGSVLPQTTALRVRTKLTQPALGHTRNCKDREKS